jgi:hypothetical protein
MSSDEVGKGVPKTNPFHELDATKLPTVFEAQDELETNVSPRLCTLTTGYTIQSSKTGCSLTDFRDWLA